MLLGTENKKIFQNLKAAHRIGFGIKVGLFSVAGIVPNRSHFVLRLLGAISKKVLGISETRSKNHA